MDKTVQLALDFKFDSCTEQAKIDSFMKMIYNKILDISENENVEVVSDCYYTELDNN